MKTPAFRTFIFACLCLLSITVLSCKKKSDTPATPTTYSSLADFYAKNGVQSQFFNINATTGGSFTTAQGTRVTIGPNSFVDFSNNPVGGIVRIEFKDIYKKSDMLMSQKATIATDTTPLVSAGEFFIKVTQDSILVNLTNKTSISIAQPVNILKDTAKMKPFVMTSGGQWLPVTNDSVTYEDQIESYVYTLYHFSTPAGSGTWCNSDNSSYFSGYKQTTLTIVPDFIDTAYDMDVYLIFKGMKSMLHVYADGGNTEFQYRYAPKGLSCTVVVVGVKHSDHKLYSSFTPITISENQTVKFNIAPITISDFKSNLTALDN